MAARAMWKAVVRLGGEEVPVKLYAAVEDRRVHFRLLHAADGEPVRQRMVHPGSGEEVERDDIRRGVEVEAGVFVVLEPDELAELEPPASREVEVTRCLERGAIDHAWYDRPYFLGPDGDPGPYFALVTALTEAGAEAVCRWVMRSKRYQGALRAERGYLVLTTLRSAEEVVPVSELAAPPGRKLDPKELKLAEQLIEALAGEFDPTEYHDEYRERVQELVDAKARGEELELRRPKARKPVRALRSALEASLKAARERRVA